MVYSTPTRACFLWSLLHLDTSLSVLFLIKGRLSLSRSSICCKSNEQYQTILSGLFSGEQICFSLFNMADVWRSSVSFLSPFLLLVAARRPLCRATKTVVIERRSWDNSMVESVGTRESEPRTTRFVPVFWKSHPKSSNPNLYGLSLWLTTSSSIFPVYACSRMECNPFPFPFPIESWTDVWNDFVQWESVLQIFNLLSQVPLVIGADSRIDIFFFWGCSLVAGSAPKMLTMLLLLHRRFPPGVLMNPILPCATHLLSVAGKHRILSSIYSPMCTYERERD